MRHGLVKLLSLVSLPAALALAVGACTDGDIRKGCENYCKCHAAQHSAESCRASCEKTLGALKKRDRPRAKQVADCLAAKGKRSCDELALCAQGVL